jgi:hypothetical protein
MLTRFICLASLLLLAACSTTSSSYPSSDPMLPTWQDQDAAVEQEAVEEEPSRGIGHRLLWYIPNRISDVLDIVRARVRVGPGIALGVRATELVDVYLGSYATVFVGVPGPRRERSFNWPFGVESKSGIEVSVADASMEGDIGPNYGWVEVGLGFQALIVGVDVGVDVLEVVDLVTGLILIDIIGDDI